MSLRKLNIPTPGPSTPSQLYGYDASASAWYALSVDTSGNLSIKHSVEIEIVGTDISVQAYDASLSGTTTLVTASASQQFNIYKAFASFSATMTGAVSLFVGTRKIGSILNPIPGGNHVLMSANPDFEQGSAGGSLSIVLPSAQSATITLHWEDAT